MNLGETNVTLTHCKQQMSVETFFYFDVIVECDRSTWPANRKFDPSNSKFGRTLSGDRPLFSALAVGCLWTCSWKQISEAVILSHECNFSYCIEEPEKFSTSTEFEPMTLQCQCDALNNWAMKLQMVGAGHLWVQMFLWWMKQWRKISDNITNFSSLLHSFIWNESYIEMWIWNQVKLWSSQL